MTVLEVQQDILHLNIAHSIVQHAAQMRNTLPLLDRLDRDQLEVVAAHLIRLVALVAAREHGYIHSDATLDQLVQGLEDTIPPYPDDDQPAA